MEGDNTGDSNTLGAKDPYGALQDSQRDSIRPDDIPRGEEDVPTSQQNARDTLSNAEQLASSGKDLASAASGNPIAAGRAAASFINNTKGKTPRGEEKSKSSMKGVLKKAGPTGTVAIVIGGLIAILALVATAMPVHLYENINSAFDSAAATNDMHTKKSWETMLSDSASAGYIEIGDDQCADLESHDVIPSQCSEGIADADIQAYFRDKLLQDSTTASTTEVTRSTGNVVKWTSRDGAVHIIDSSSFGEWFDSNPAFREAITRGSLAWTGSFSVWFDDIAQSLMEQLQTTRNAFEDYYEDINDQIKSEETYREIIEAVNTRNVTTHSSREKIVFFKSCGSTQRKGIARATELRDANDSQLTTITNIEPDEGGSCTISNPPEVIKNESRICTPIPDSPNYSCLKSVWYETETSTEVSTALEDAKAKVSTYLPEMVNTFYNGSDAANNDECAPYFGLSYFSAITAANRLRQTSDFAVKALETIDKMRVGEGSTSPTHQLSNLISELGTFEYMPAGSTELTQSTTERPALNAAGLSWITTGSAVDIEDANIKKLSLEGIMKGFFIDAGILTSCNLSNLLGGVINGLLSVLVKPVILLFSDANEEYLFVNGQEAQSLLDKAIAQAAYGLIFNPCTDQPAGEDIGNCLALGSHYYLSKNHQLSGGSPADQAKLTAYLEEQYKVTAYKAELERSSRSPFDISSQHTFLGSIIHQITPYVSSLSASNAISSIGSIVTSSINSLLPTASALQAEAALTNIGDCQYLGSGSYANSEGGIGAVGDAFCVPYIIDDVSTKDMDPMDIEKKLRELQAFDGEDEKGNPTINKKSNFARYVVYCSNRLSMFGVVDAEILNDFVENKDKGFFYNILSFLGLKKQARAIEIQSNREDILGWSTGSYCVATDDAEINPLWNSEMRYYQAYMTYQRINTARGGVAGNNSLDVIADYRETHPLDNSEDGILARIAGMKKEDYVAMRDYIIYYATDKSSFGPTVATTSATPNSTPKFRSRITPLTDFILDAIVPLANPNTTDPHIQGITA